MASTRRDRRAVAAFTAGVFLAAAPAWAQAGQLQARTLYEVRFFLDVGELEDHLTLGGSGPNFRDANRRFRDALRARGYEVTYTEVPAGNHDYRWWRPRLGEGIVALSAPWR